MVLVGSSLFRRWLWGRVVTATERNDEDDDDYEDKEGDSTKDVVCALACLLLVSFRLGDLVVRFLRVVLGSGRVLVDLHQIVSLLVHVLVDRLSDGVDVAHQLLDVVQVFLSLMNDIGHVVGFSTDLELDLVELLPHVLRLSSLLTFF